MHLTKKEVRGEKKFEKVVSHLSQFKTERLLQI